jgi:Triphosphoribosyl-dephospho-CoA synthetase
VSRHVSGYFSAQLADAIESACAVEVRSLKPGNVSTHSAGHGMVAEDFFESARRIAPILAGEGLSVGTRILESVRATYHAVGCNTNLGIVLLCAPLAHAALLRDVQGPLRQRLAHVLEMLDVQDAARTFEAIHIAAPAGLGQSERHDVCAPPRVTLLEAMREARSRDRIAYQYASQFEDVFEFGAVRAQEALARWEREEWAAVVVYLGFLARFPDTHIVRKFGHAVAEAVRREGVAVESRVLACKDPEYAIPLLLEFDARLKASGINPGTSADLTVASLLVPRINALFNNDFCSGAATIRPGQYTARA